MVAELKEKDDFAVELLKEKKTSDKTLNSLKARTAEAEEKLEQKASAEEQLRKEREAAENKSRNLEITVAEKEDEFKEQANTHKFEMGELEKKLKRLEKQVKYLMILVLHLGTGNRPLQIFYTPNF